MNMKRDTGEEDRLSDGYFIDIESIDERLGSIKGKDKLE